MKFIGNYADWIEDRWIEHILKNDGIMCPRDQNLETSGELSPFDETGWDIKCVCCIMYEQHMFPYKVNIPWPLEKNHEWWMMKLPVGMGQPWHRDSLKESADGNETINENRIVKRYWMPFQDYAPGHIFIYEDRLITGYKKGDLYLYDNEQAYHTAGNLGWSTRISLNLTTWNDF
jgi:hypothetical protein